MPDILRFDDSRATRIAQRAMQIASRLKRDATGNLLLSGTVCAAWCHGFVVLHGVG